jgi:hypothetical protein
MNQHGNNMTTPHTGALRIKQFADEGRIIRGQWHRTDSDGRELACLLGAVGADVNSPSKCPAEVMPAWLAYLTPSIDDNISASAWPAIIRRYADCAVRWHVLTPDDWRRCEMKVKREALLIAQPFDNGGSCATVLDLIDMALAGDEPSESDWRDADADAADAADAAYAAAAAYAADADADAADAAAADAAAYAAAAAAADADADADAAAYAAYVAAAAAAAAAAYADADSDADADAYAAYAADADAAYAARTDGAAVNRAYVARAAAWDRIADACLSAIEHELEQA